MAYEAELGVALAAAERAGAVVLDHYARFVAIPDAAADISTQADRDSQEAILQHLRRAYPHDRLCAEEATPTLRDAPQTGPRLWIIDPIDGTRGFARKNGEFSVMIALLDVDRIAVGVVLEPVAGRTTYARRGGGCWRQDSGPPIACRVRDSADLSQAILTQSHSRPGAPQSAVERLQPQRVVETYSAGLKLALVARGEADLYVNSYRHFNDWDACAGQILVEEAGGRVTGLRGEEIRYDVGQAAQRDGLLASNGRLHETALARLRK